MSGREKGLVLFLILIAVPLGLWFLVAVPLIDARESSVLRLSEARELQTWVVARDAEWRGRTGGEINASRIAPVGLSGLDRALTDAGLRDTATRLENTRSGGIAIRLDAAEFVQVGPFLESVERRLGYDIASLRVLRSDLAGYVTVEVELTPES